MRETKGCSCVMCRHVSSAVKGFLKRISSRKSRRQAREAIRKGAEFPLVAGGYAC